jgi:hypothetical protein
MTALSEYQRLETPGLWRASAEDQRRDVIVSVGDATLVIYDGAGRPLAHWSLAAVERLNPGLRPAQYRPGPDSPEELELTAPEMIEAIERVRRAIQRRRPHQGRLRLFLMGGALGLVLLAGALWLPDALVRHASVVVPYAKRVDLGERLLAEITDRTGAPCDAPLGRAALDRLQARLLPDARLRLEVLPGGIPRSLHLPGGLILLHRELVEEHEDPGVVAGYVLAEHARRAAADPVERLLEDAGFLAAFRFLTTGDVPEEVLAEHAARLAEAPRPAVPAPALTEVFAGAGLPASPYAYAEDPSGETTLELIEADTVSAFDAIPALPDSAWVSLQGICSG